MGNIFNADFRDFIAALNNNQVRYILVGGYFTDDELKIRVIHKNDLIAAKQKAGRSKDLDDLENLNK